MTKNELKRVITGQAKLGGMPTTANLEGLVGNAIDLAGPLVWKAYGWNFRRKEDTITTIASQEYVNLPPDFDGFKNLRFRDGGQRGWEIGYYDEDTYEFAWPNPLLFGDNEPRLTKIVKDATTGWRAYFTPRPNAGYTLTLIYVVKWGAIGRFPSGFEKLIQAAVWLFMYPAGSEGWQRADIAYNLALQQTIDDIDPPVKKKPGVIRRQSRFRHEMAGSDRWDWWNVNDGSDF